MPFWFFFFKWFRFTTLKPLFTFLFFLSLPRYQFCIFFPWYLPNRLFYIPVTTSLARSLLLHTHNWNAAWVVPWLWVSPFSRLILNLDFIMSHLVTCPLKFRYFYSRSLAYGLIPYWIYIIILTKEFLWEINPLCTEVYLGCKKLSWTLQDDGKFIF